MTKFSDFIRAPGTAGPPTREGIRALGFALQSDFPVELEEYLWVGGVQSFTTGQKLQGRANLGVVIGTDVQAYSAALASLAGLTTAADRLPYTTGPNVYAVTTLTAFGRSLIDDASASAARTTLGLGNVDNTSDANKPVSTATQTALNLKADLASPPLTGTPTAPTAAPGTNTTQIATTAFVTAATSTAITKKYLSSNQMITSAGPLALAHGLGVVPEIVMFELECITTDAGFAAGKVIVVYPAANGLGSSGAASNGFIADKDATTINIRYGSGGTPFQVPNGTNGTIANLTNASWRFRVRAFA